MNEQSDSSRTTAERDVRRKRLYYQSCHRGMKEMDIILGGFAAEHIDALDAGELDALERLLALPDDALYVWFSGREPVPAELDTALFKRIGAWIAANARP
jgi:antitoxin CptB